jgi:hypothetical protein
MSHGKLEYLANHCARLCKNPTMAPTEAVHHIVWFLTGTQDKGIILQPREESFECSANTDFCGLWDKNTAEEDSNIAKLRMCYLLTYVGCPLVWASKLAETFCLSTTDAIKIFHNFETSALQLTLSKYFITLKLVQSLVQTYLQPILTQLHYSTKAHC